LLRMRIPIGRRAFEARVGDVANSYRTKRPPEGGLSVARCNADQAKRSAGPFRFRRYAMKPTPKKPRIIMAQVEGSGTAVVMPVVGPKNKSTPDELGTVLLPKVPDITADVALSGMKKLPTTSVSKGPVVCEPPLNSGRDSVTGAPLVVKVIEVTPRRITKGDVCSAVKASLVPRPSRPSSPLERVPLQIGAGRS
jgi:hypothetical protein